MQSGVSFHQPPPPMDLSRPVPFPTFPFLARLLLLLPRFRAAARETDGPAPDGPAPALLHHDLGLPPADATPPDAQALRHDLLGHGSLW